MASAADSSSGPAGVGAAREELSGADSGDKDTNKSLFFRAFLCCFVFSPYLCAPDRAYIDLFHWAVEQRGEGGGEPREARSRWRAGKLTIQRSGQAFAEHLSHRRIIGKSPVW